MAKIVSDKITINLSKIIKNDDDRHGIEIWDDATISQITKIAEKLFEGTGVVVEVEKSETDEE